MLNPGCTKPSTLAAIYVLNMIIRLFLAAVLVCYTLTSCSPYKFDDADLNIINTYAKGDTLVFITDDGRRDSIEITDKEFYLNGYSEGYEGNPQGCRIYYKTIPPGKMVLAGFGGTQGDVYKNEFTFLSAVKYDRNKPATITIKLLGFDAKIPNNFINRENNSDTSVDLIHFCHDCIGVDSMDVVKIKWQSNVGVVMYQRKDSIRHQLILRNRNSR